GFNEISTVMYAEVITPDGKKIIGGKYPIQQEISEGCLKLPDDMISGIYYVRAYTKWMRNQGPESYAYVMLKIVNPNRTEVLTTQHLGPEASAVTDQKTSTGFELTSNAQTFSPGTPVTIKVNETLGSDKIVHSTCSVAPKWTSAFDGAIFNSNDQPKSQVEFVAESKGVTITGKVMDLKTNQPLVKARVDLSIIGRGRDFMAAETDSSGHYYFSLPDFTGHRDLFLCVEQDSFSHPKLLVDNDFCTIPVHLPSPEFSLSSEERTVVTAMMQNVQLNHYFTADTAHCRELNPVVDKAFYGEPTDVIFFDQYVQLPTIEEYFNELPTPVKVRRHNGHRYFKVIGTAFELSYFNPLVLVDWVAVSNPEKILAASPNTIERIEVVNTPYVKGDITYGGVVSILSKKGDFGGIDLPSSGIFLQYLFQSDTCHCAVLQPSGPSLPDTRNTVYWNPDVRFDSNSHADINFIAPQTPGQYRVTVRGIKESGGEVKGEILFDVLNSH
ncbi:MAG TPA: hypothetical protein VJ508_19930, partial [Saprospiraceae bacterium]|nr:hypothetical protein [Saprospiraceae bacterium]